MLPTPIALTVRKMLNVEPHKACVCAFVCMGNIFRCAKSCTTFTKAIAITLVADVCHDHVTASVRPSRHSRPSRCYSRYVQFFTVHHKSESDSLLHRSNNFNFIHQLWLFLKPIITGDPSDSFFFLYVLFASLSPLVSALFGWLHPAAASQLVRKAVAQGQTRKSC